MYLRKDRHSILLKLLKERDETTNISHRKLPTWESHCAFVDRLPYRAWYFIGPEPKGACYLTHQNEIGIFIFKNWQGHGVGPQAVKAIIEKHGPGRYLANINPANGRSIELFKTLGFKHVQNTYECVSDC